MSHFSWRVASRIAAAGLAALLCVPRLAATPPAVRAAEPAAPPCAGWADPFRPPAAIHVAVTAGGAVASVSSIAFRSYVARALAAAMPATAPVAALEAAAILVKQAAWIRAMELREGFWTPSGTCYDVRDDIDGRLAAESEVQPQHLAALDATWTVTLRRGDLQAPFFLPHLRSGGAACPPGPASALPVVELGALAACGTEGLDRTAMLTRLLGPALELVDALGLGGRTRYDTAVAVSRAILPESTGATVYVATGLDFPDALAAGPAAAIHDGALLLVPGTSLPAAVAEELARLVPARILVVGGPAVVSASVLQSLTRFSPDVARVAGATRYDTALAVSRFAFPAGAATVFVATGANFPDAVAGASAAAHLGGPILLVPGGTTPAGPFAAALAAELARLHPATIHVLGGPAVVSEAWIRWLGGRAPTVTRLGGANRYATAATISAAVYGPAQPVLRIATGDQFPDGLVAAPLGGPLLLVATAEPWPRADVIAEARRLAPIRVEVLGGGMVVPDGAIRAVLGGQPPPATDVRLEAYSCTALPGNPLLDAAGVPMTLYGGKPEYNPVQVAQWGLAHHERWLRLGTADDRTVMLAMADWLVAAQQATGLWHYTFAFAGQPIPWWSALAQGQAVSLLLRAWQEAGTPAYLEAARAAVATMHRAIADRGVAAWDAGSYWLEEYLPPYSQHTLNGMLLATEGLREWVLVTGDPVARAWVRDAESTIRTWLPRFDTGAWSTYNSRGTRASLKYHLIHVMALRHLARLTMDPAIAAVAARWATYALTPPT